MREKADHVVANMEQLGVQAVRDMVSSGRWPANYDALAREWLQQKEFEDRKRESAHRDAQMFVARKSNELANAARNAALDANKQADDAAAVARGASSTAQAASAFADRSAQMAASSRKIAIAALVVAIVAIGISVVPLIIKYVFGL